MTIESPEYWGTKKSVKVYIELIKVAREGKTINYQDIAEIMELPSSGDYMARETGKMVGEISEFEHKYGRPMLSAVVVRKETGMPGDGFFDLAGQLGKYQPHFNKKTFWEMELQAVYDTWG